MTDHRLSPSRLALLAVLLVTAAGTAAHAQVMTDPDLTVTTVVPSGGGLDQPTTMKFVADDDFLVLEKATGRVRRVVNDALQPGFALDVNVNSTSERGMLGIAVAPGTPMHVFLYYTEAQGSDGGTALGNRVYRYDWDPSAGPSGALTNPQLVLDLPVNPGPNHDAGVILLDAQGLLYVFIGDLNHNGQLQNNSTGAAPDNTGVIFRVNQDGTPAAGNPFAPYCSVTTTQLCTATPDCPAGQTCITNVARYYAYGVRNGFGLEFDRGNGDALWMTENGPSDFDELNKVDAGWNGGWNKIHGPDALDPQGTGDLWNMPNEGLTYSDPEFSWQQVQVPTGVNFPFNISWGPAYNNKVLVGTNSNGDIYSFPLNGTRTGLDTALLPPPLQDLVAANSSEANLVRIGSGFGAITDLELGPEQPPHLYVVDIFGRIFRIEGPVPVTLQGFTVE
jgi:glucose/arabinose dehydrogenase